MDDAPAGGAPQGEPCVEVLLPLALPGTLTYRVPAELVPRLRVGQRVAVPLGTRRASGYVVEIRSGPRDPGTALRLRDVAAILDDVPPLGEELLGFLREAARYYLAPPGEALRVALPRVAERGARRVKTVRRGAAAVGELRLGPRQRSLLAALETGGEMALGAAQREHGVAADAVRRLARCDLVVVEEREERDPFAALEAGARDEPPVLNEAQQRAVAAIVGATRAGAYRGFLLHGVTASGKTEVYLRCAGEVLGTGRSCLVLVPEIALTPQLVQRFRARLGEGVAVLHSALPDGERRRAWAAMRDGRIRVVVGARSALFAPLGDLALVVVDEEHDGSFKQADRFRYHARDLAMLRAQRAKAVVVLGSATPSLETYRNAHTGKLELLRLPDRATPRPLPGVRVCDLRLRGRRHAGHPFLTLDLIEELQRTLARDDQAILFLNRRGFAPAAVCSSCGAILQCPSCGVALAYHRARDALLCHYCGFRRDVPPRCDTCREGPLDLRGLGTERVVAAVQELFPAARVGRLDSDIAPGAASERVLDRLRRRELDVLVGTQMVTKGHDFPGVTLVGILRADMGLQVADFRAAERTFQLLTQVAGRAGRGDTPGLVLLQTYLPDHYAIAAAARQDYEAFVRAELPFRRELGYPPFGYLALVRGESPDDGRVTAAMEALALDLAPVAEQAGATLLGPCPAPLARLRGVHRRHLLIKAGTRRAVRGVAERVATWAERPLRGVRILLDIDPVHLA